MTYEQVLTLTTLISAAQGVSFADESKTKVWFSLLDDLDFETAHLALKKLLRTEQSNITPAHIRNTCVELIESRIDTISAVNLVYKVLNDYGRNASKDGLACIEKNDPIAYQIVKSIGYSELCNGNSSFTRPEFERLYREAAKTIQIQKALSPELLGQINNFKAKLVQSNLIMLVQNGDNYGEY